MMELRFGYLKVKMRVYDYNIEKSTKADSTIFWGSTYAYFGAWAVLFLWEVIRLRFVWAIIALVMLIFASTNMYGYLKYSKEQQNVITKIGAKAVLTVAEKGVDAAKNKV